MRKLFLFLLAIIVLIPVAYAAIALRAYPSTDPVVNLIGPGSTPSVCIARARPHFERMEGALTDIAEALIASDDLVNVAYSLDRDRKPFLFVGTKSGRKSPTPDENNLFIPKYQSVGGLNYYFPGFFIKQDSKVAALTISACGITSLYWMKLRLGLQNAPPTKPAAITVGFIYWPQGIPDFEKCVDPAILKPEEIMICEIALNEKWSWYSEWVLYRPLSE